MVTIEDCVEAEEIFKADAEVQRLIRERYGITDMAEVACDPWYYGGRFGAPAPSLPPPPRKSSAGSLPQNRGSVWWCYFW